MGAAGHFKISGVKRNLSHQPLLQLLELHVPLADELGDANKVVVLQVEEGIRGRGVDQLVVDIGKVLVPAGLFGPGVLQRSLRKHTFGIGS